MSLTPVQVASVLTDDEVQQLMERAMEKLNSPFEVVHIARVGNIKQVLVRSEPGGVQKTITVGAPYVGIPQ